MFTGNIASAQRKQEELSGKRRNSGGRAQQQQASTAASHSAAGRLLYQAQQQQAANERRGSLGAESDGAGGGGGRRPSRGGGGPPSLPGSTAGPPGGGGKGGHLLFRVDAVLPEETAVVQKEVSSRVHQVQADSVSQSAHVEDPIKLYHRRYEYNRLFEKLGRLSAEECQILASIDAVGWDEESVTTSRQRWLLHPDKGLKLRWDMFFVFLIVYTSISVPYKIGFDVEFSGFWYVVDVVVDMAYYTDIIISFLTAYYDKRGTLIRDRHKIARRYLRGSFTIDLISSLPLDRILDVLQYGNAKLLSSTKLLRLLRLTRVLRLLRLVKFEKFLGVRQMKLEQELQLNNAVASIIRMAFPVVLMGHILACTFHFLVVLYQDRQHHQQEESSGLLATWISKIYKDEVVPTHLAYHTALYWAFTTTTTVGYGDVLPINDGERLLAMLAMIIGGSTFGYIVGNVTVIFEGVDIQSKSFRQRMDTVMGYVKERRLPQALSDRIRSHLRHMLRKVCVYDTSLIFTALPAVVDAQLSLVQHGEMISKIGFFHDKPVMFVAALAKLLRPCLVRRGEVIFFRAEVGSAVYFLCSGQVDCVLMMDDIRSTFTTLTQGAILGTVGVFEESVQLYTAKAGVDSELYWVNKEDLICVLESWPGVREELTRMARDRLDEIASHRRAMAMPNSPLRRHTSSCVPEDDDVEDWLLTPNRNCIARVGHCLQHKGRGLAYEAYRRLLLLSKGGQGGEGGMSRQSSSADSYYLAPSPGDSMRSLPPPAIIANVRATPTSLVISPAQAGKEPPLTPSPSAATSTDAGGVSVSNPIIKMPSSSRLGNILRGKLLKVAPEGSSSSFPPAPLEPPDPPPRKHFSSSASPVVVRPPPPVNESLRSLLEQCYGLDDFQSKRGENIDTSSFSRSYHLLHPDSQVRGYWDVFTSLIIMYSILTVTFRLGFDASLSEKLLAFDMVVDLLFCLDIILYTQTAYWDDSGTLVMDRKRIFWRYASTWLLWDIASTLPLDTIMSFVGSGSSLRSPPKMLRILRLARLVRLSRLFKVTKLLQKYEEQFNINPAVLRVFMVFSAMAFLAHFHACVFYYIGAVAVADDDLESTWVRSYCPGDGRRCLDSMSYPEKYVAALYWSFTTMCTVGYGDVTPDLHRRGEMTWAMVTQLVGATVFAYSISSMVDLLASIDLPEKLRKEEMTTLRDYLATLSWGPKRTSRYRLMKTIRRVYTQFLGFRSVFPEQAILLDLPPNIRNQVLRYSYRSLSSALPALGLMDRTFRGSFPLIAQRMRWAAFLKGEVLSSPNTACREMYFLASGWCEATATAGGATNSSNKSVAAINFSPGDTLNEATFLVPDYIPIRLVHTVTALTDCQLAIYSKRDFEELRIVYPAVASLFKSTFLSVTPEHVHTFLDIPPAFLDEIDRIFWPQDDFNSSWRSP